jgi:ATP-binding cassette subfamily C (CFTR/MRP) protein 2
MSYSHVIYWLSILGVNLENSLTMMIYAKSLKFAEQANKSFTEAEIINYSQVDAEKMTNIGYHLSAFFYGPFQFVIGLIMLYWTLGITFLTAVGIMTVVLIISYFLSKISARYNEDILKAKDERMKVTQ